MGLTRALTLTLSLTPTPTLAPTLTLTLTLTSLKASPVERAATPPDEPAEWELLAEEGGPLDQPPKAPKKKVYSSQFLLRFQAASTGAPDWLPTHYGGSAERHAEVG